MPSIAFCGRLFSKSNPCFVPVPKSRFLLKDGSTPLIQATWIGDLDCVKLLLKGKADVLASDKVEALELLT